MIAVLKMDKINAIFECIFYGSMSGFVASVIRPKRPLWYWLIINIVLGSIVYFWVSLGINHLVIDDQRKTAIGALAGFVAFPLLHGAYNFIEAIAKDPVKYILKLLGRK
jgi:ethanolamine transporter EutH